MVQELRETDGVTNMTKQKDPLEKIMNEREKAMKKMNRTPEEEIRGMAIRMFFKVGVGFSSLLFAIIFFSMTVLYATTDSILHPEYKTYWPWTLLVAIILSILGIVVLTKSFKHPDPYTYPKGL